MKGIRSKVTPSSTLVLVSLVIMVLALGLVGCGGGTTTTAVPDTTGQATTTGTQATGEPLIIGAILDITGPASESPTADALPMVVEEMNKAGGIAGHPITLIVKDTKGDPALSAPATQEVLAAGAQVVIMQSMPGVAAGVIATAAAKGVPCIGHTGTTPSLTRVGGVRANLVLFGDNAEAAAMAEYAYKSGARTAWVIGSPDLEYTDGLAKYFAETWEHLGGKVIGTDTFSLSQEDFSPQVTKIAALATQPDVIWKGIIIPGTGTFMRQLRAAGVKSMVVGNDGDLNKVVLDIAKEAAEGLIIPGFGFPSPGSPRAAFEQRLEAYLGHPPDDPSLSSASGDVMAVIKAAVEKAGSLDPKAISEAINQTDGVVGVNGAPITLKGTDGVPIRPIFVLAIENGKQVLKEQLIPSWVPKAR